jgi:hypothetical protein
MVAPENLARLYRRIVCRGQWGKVNADLTDRPQAQISPFKTFIARLHGGLFLLMEVADTPST